MDTILDFIDQLLEVEAKRDIDFKNFCHSIHKDSKAIGESPMIVHLRTLKEIVKNNMTQEQQTVLLIKGAISELPAAKSEACKELAEHIRAACKVAGEPVGTMALALVCAEEQQARAT